MSGYVRVANLRVSLIICFNQKLVRQMRWSCIDTATPFISICILSYNRPETLLRLLGTIDARCTEDIEVVVCEDCSPRQQEIRRVVSDFAAGKPYPVRHFENERNLGYDGTFNRLVQHAAGRWLVFMGDDDEFIPHAFDKMYAFLKEHPDLGYGAGSWLG